MNKIIPSTKLKVITVHKLWDMSCLRKYFWHRVLNLESRILNIAYWYGSLTGAGLEALLLGKDPERAIRIEDRKRRAAHITSAELEEEMRLQRRLISAFIAGAKRHPKVRKMKLIHTQQKFRVRLQDSRLWFCGTRDGDGTYCNKTSLFECKALSRVTSSTISALTFDKQINGYTYARRLEKKPVFPRCCYCIFRKPQKKIKRNQTVDQFVTEITRDLAERPDFYYFFQNITLGKLTVEETGYDIEADAIDLKEKYKRLGTDSKILDPHNWPKQETKCTDYKGCEFLQLCKNSKKWQLYLRLFQQRQMLYEEEKKELQK